MDGKEKGLPWGRLQQADPALWVIVLYFIAFCSLYFLSPTIVGALVFGWYLSMIINVPARLISRIRFISYRAGIVLSAILIFSVLLICVVSVFPIVYDEGKNLFKIISSGIPDTDLPQFLQGTRFAFLFEGSFRELLNETLQQAAQWGVKGLNLFIQGLPAAFTGLVIFILAASSFSGLTPVIRKHLWRFFPASTREKSIGFITNFYRQIQGFIRGQLIIAACVGLVVGVGMMIAGLPYALFLGFLSFITNFIPFLGVIITSVPAILLAVSHGGLWGVLKVVLVMVAANQLESWVLSPKIQGDRMEINWFAIILGLLFMGALLGLVGVLIAVPLLVFFKTFWISYVQDFFGRI